MLRLDHLAVSCTDLDAGVDHVEAALGVQLGAGVGKHPLMGTHNRLLNLGEWYLEVIAVDPAAPPPGRPRWFDLDRFAGLPRLTNWICASDDLTRDLNKSPPGTGRIIDFARGEYCWQMAVPEDGVLPFDGAHPALIQWLGDAHPARALPDVGVRLIQLNIAHPQANALREWLTPRLTGMPVRFETEPGVAIRATFSTPQGARTLT